MTKASIDSSWTRVLITLPVPVSDRVSFLMNHEYTYYTKDMPEYCKTVIQAAKKFGCSVRIVRHTQEEIEHQS